MPNYLDNNPNEFDSNEDARDAVRGAGGDPMDIGTKAEATYGWAILDSWEDDPPESRSDREVFAAEAEMVATELEHSYGVDVDDWPEIDNAPDWYDGP